MLPLLPILAAELNRRSPYATTKKCTNPQMITISKISLSGKGVAITYQNPDAKMSVAVTCEEPPVEKLELAYLAQKNVVDAMLPFSLGQDDYQITSVGYDSKAETVEYHVSFACDGMGAAATLKMPKIRRHPPEGNPSPKKNLEDVDKANEWFDELLDQAREYVKGKRSQGELFDNAESESDDE